MGNMSKLVASVVGAALVFVVDAFGGAVGLAPDWADKAMVALTPLIVYFFPANKPS